MEKVDSAIVEEVSETFEIEGAAWARKIDGPGEESVTTLVADDTGVTILGHFEYEIDLGSGVLGTSDTGDEFANNLFLGSFSSEGKARWSTTLGGASGYPASAMVPSSEGGVLALVPLAQLDGTTRLERVHAHDGKYERSTVSANKELAKGLAVSKDWTLATSTDMESSFLIPREASPDRIVNLPPIDAASRDGRTLAGSYYETWKVGNYTVPYGKCDDEEDDGCGQAYILGLDLDRKVQWAHHFGDENDNDSAGPVASNPQGGVAVVLSLGKEGKYQIGSTTVPLSKVALVKLAKDGEFQWAAKPPGRILDIFVTAKGEVYTVSFKNSHQYVDNKKVFKRELVLTHYDKRGNATFKNFGDEDIKKENARIAVSPKGQVYIAWTRNFAREKPSESILIRVEARTKQ